jgi:acetylxylan esterase
MRSLAALVAAFALTRVAISLSGSLTQMADFQSTVSDVSMWTYIPANLPTDEEQAIVVAIHSCERSAQYYYDNTGYAALADQEGYMVIYPNKSTSNGCWDVSFA